METPVKRFVVRCPHALSLRRTVMSHGWVGLAPWRWEDEKGGLGRPERLPSGAKAQIEAIQQTPLSFVVTVDGGGLGPADLEWARAMVARWLSVDWDPEPAIAVASRLDPATAAVIRDGGGRFLRGSTFYEDFAKTMCTIQIAWSGTKRMVASLVDEIGDGLFPTPRNVLDAGEAVLRGNARLGFRAPQLLVATEELLKRGLMNESGRGAEGLITYEEMIGLRGIGPYAASHIAMLLHDFSRIPVDSEVSRFFRERHGLAADEIEGFFDRWGEYRILGYKLMHRQR